MEKKLVLNDCQMDMITFGKGKKKLVMIQGLNTKGIRGSGFMLSLMYKIFIKDYQVYLFDRKENLNINVTIEELANDLVKAMDALNIKNADILGVSQGGMIAQSLAIQRPDLVNKLVLAVTSSKNNEVMQEVLEHWIGLTEQENWKGLVEDMAMKMYSDEYIKKYKMMMPLLTIMQKPKDVQRFLTLTKACLTCNTYEMLDKIQCPVFVIGGKEDKIVTSNASVEIAQKLNCEFYFYDKLGHACYEEASDFNQRVLDFFRK